VSKSRTAVAYRFRILILVLTWLIWLFLIGII
jgi:hypothetical protein